MATNAVLVTVLSGVYKTLIAMTFWSPRYKLKLDRVGSPALMRDGEKYKYKCAISIIAIMTNGLRNLFKLQTSSLM